MNRNIIFSFVFIIFFAIGGFVFAANPAYIFKQNTISSVVVSCFDENNTLCLSTVSCRLTVFKPNNELLINNVSMSFNGNYWNYTLDSGQTQTLGTHYAIVFCDGSKDGFSTFYYDVTSSGNDRDNWVFLILTISSVLFLIITYMTRDPIIGFIDGLLFLVTGVYVMIYGLGDLNSLYTRTIAFVSIGMGLLLIISSAFDLNEEDEPKDGE